MSHLSDNEFLSKLKKEAEAQARLEKHRFLPQELDGFTSFIGRHAWQVLVVTSGLTSLALELLKIAL